MPDMFIPPSPRSAAATPDAASMRPRDPASDLGASGAADFARTLQSQIEGRRSAGTSASPAERAPQAPQGQASQSAAATPASGRREQPAAEAASQARAVAAKDKGKATEDAEATETTDLDATVSASHQASPSSKDEAVLLAGADEKPANDAADGIEESAQIAGLPVMVAPTNVPLAEVAPVAAATAADTASPSAAAVAVPPSVAAQIAESAQGELGDEPQAKADPRNPNPTESKAAPNGGDSLAAPAAATDKAKPASAAQDTPVITEVRGREPAVRPEPVMLKADPAKTIAPEPAGPSLKPDAESAPNALAGLGAHAASRAPGASAPPAPTAFISTPASHAGFADELGQRVMLFAGRGESRAELILTPAHLGRVEISLTVSAEHTTAQFVAANPAARDALEQALPKLREMLAQAGITLGESNVDTHSRRDGSEGRRSAAYRGPGQAVGADPAAPSGRVWTQRGPGLIDTFA